MAHQMPRRKLGSQGLEVSALGLGCMGMSAFYGKPLDDKDGVAVIHHAFENGVTFFDTSDAYGPHTNEKLLGLVSALGLGCMGMSAFYGKPLDDKDGIAVIQHAFENGVTFFDTSDAYGPYTNEKLLGLALKTLPRDKVQLATKFAASWEDGKPVIRGDAEFVRKCCEDSLERLGLDYIDLYYQHRVDPKVPIEVTVGAMKKLVEEGKVKYLGLSEANVDTIRRAHAVHPISALQIEWSLWTRDIEEEIIPVCRELGIGIVPYSPLGRGFFSGKAVVETLSETDPRMVRFPRFQEENLEKNKVLYERVAALAKRHKCTPGQLALAWVLHQGGDVVPIPGTTKIPNLDENLGAAFAKLSPEETKEVAAAVPEHEVGGSRCGDDYFRMSWAQVTTPPLSSYAGSQ